MSKEIVKLSYKDLHAIKHALQDRIEAKNDKILEWRINGLSSMEEYEKLKQDGEHETKLLERITEKINYLKDKYKI